MDLILILDTYNAPLLSALSDLLMIYGHLAITTTDMFEAWALLHALPFDLFIQDVYRTSVNGRDFCDRLRADPDMSPIPVIMMTSRWTDELCRWALRAGMVDAIAKPFDPDTLLAKIETVFREHGYQSQKDPTIASKIKTVLAMTHPDQLMAALGDPLPEARLLAAWVLGQRRLTRAMPSLLTALDDGVDHVRGAAALALGRMQAHAAFDPLVAALRDPSPLIRMMASRALLHLGDDRAIDPLMACMEDGDFWVRVSAARAAGRLKENDPLLFCEAWDF